MKKIFIVLALAMVVLSPMFADATNGAQSTDPATLVVQHVVGKSTLYGFSTENLDATPYTEFNAEKLIKAGTIVDVNSGATGNTFYAVLKTNSAEKASITVAHTNLKSGDNEVAMTLNGSAAGTDVVLLEGAKDTATNARVIAKEFKLVFDSANAPEGTYQATITMTVTGA